MSQAPPTETAADNAANERSKVEQIVATKAYVDDPELLPWYTKDVEDLQPDARDIFENYSKVPSEDVIRHIKQVRDDAFKVFPYPCLGNWGFINFSIRESPLFAEVLERVKGGESLLDVGCCMGQDLRKLAHEGAPTDNTYASDVQGAFWELGYSMFLDKSTLKTQFLEANIFDDESRLKQLEGKIDIVNAASFFHLFDWDKQVKAAKRVVQLTKPTPGSLIIGRQGGKPEAGSFAHVRQDMTSFWHNPESWAKMWKQVGNETGTEWEVESHLGDEDLSKRLKTSLVPAGTRFMKFTIRRV